jgi:hypothetical protein
MKPGDIVLYSHQYETAEVGAVVKYVFPTHVCLHGFMVHAKYTQLKLAPTLLVNGHWTVNNVTTEPVDASITCTISKPVHDRDVHLIVSWYYNIKGQKYPASSYEEAKILAEQELDNVKHALDWVEEHLNMVKLDAKVDPMIDEFFAPNTIPCQPPVEETMKKTNGVWQNNELINATTGKPIARWLLTNTKVFDHQIDEVQNTFVVYYADFTHSVLSRIHTGFGNTNIPSAENLQAIEAEAVSKGLLEVTKTSYTVHHKYSHDLSDVTFETVDTLLNYLIDCGQHYLKNIVITNEATKQKFTLQKFADTNTLDFGWQTVLVSQ